MKVKALSIVLALVFAISTPLAMRSTAHAQTVTCDTSVQFVWDGGAGTNSWDDADNWDNDDFPNTVPGTGANEGVDVCIADQTPDVAVTISSGTFSINSIESDEAFLKSGGTLNIAASSAFNDDFTLSGSIVGGAGDIVIGGSFNWAATSTMTGTGTTNANGGIEFSGNTMALGRPLTIPVGQTATWSDGNISLTEDDAVIDSNGAFEVVHAGNHTMSGSANRPLNVNNTFTKSVGTGNTDINTQFNDNVGNNSLVSVETGTLRLRTSSTLGGEVNVSQDATLDFEGGTHTLQDGASLTGDVIQTGGTVNLGESGGDTVTATSYTLSGGTLDGPGDLNMSGPFNWAATSTMTGTGTTNANGGIEFSGNTMALGRPLTIPSGQTATWSDGNISLTEDDAEINSNGAFLITHAGNQIMSGSVNRPFNVNNTLTKSTETGRTDINTQLNDNVGNNSLVSVETGTLRLRTSSTIGSEINVSENAVFDFNAGTHTLQDGASLTGDGTKLQSGATVVLSENAGNVVTATSYSLSSGILEGLGDFEISGPFNWIGTSTMRGTGTTTVNGGIEFNGGTMVLNRPLTIPAGQTATWSDGDISLNNDNAVIDSNGAFLITHAANHTMSGSVNRPFNVNNTLTKSTETGRTDINTQLNDNVGNNSLVSVETGTLRLRTSSTIGSEINVSENAVFDFNAGTHTLQDGASLTGDGFARSTGGTLNIGESGGDTVTATSYTLSGGTLDGPGDLNMSGPFNWAATSTMTGTGTTNANGGIEFNGGTMVLNRPLTIPAGQTATWSDGDISLNNDNAVIDSNGAFLITHAANHTMSGSVNRPFNVNNTLTKSTETGRTDINTQLNDNVGNNSLVSVETGTLRLRTSSTIGSEINVSENAVFDFNAGTHTLQDGVSLTGDGFTRSTSGTLNIGEASTDTITAENFEIAGGTVNVVGTLDFVGSTLNLTSGILTGAGITNIPAAGFLEISGNSNKFIIGGHTLNNNGTATFTGTGTFFIYQGAIFNNNSLFEAKSDGNIDYSSGVVGEFNNNGTYRKLDSTGTSVIDVIFNNNSPVEVQTGIVSLTRGGTSSGAMVVSPGAKLNFGGGDYDHDGTSSISGDGQMGFSGGTTDIAGTYDVGDTLVNGGTANFNTAGGMTDTMTLISGFRGGTGTLNISGLLTHSAGRFINAGITNADGGIDIIGNTNMYVIDEHTLNNNGTATFTGTGPFWIYQGGVFNNNSVFEAKGNGNIDYFDGVVGVFNNNGTYRKLDSTGTSVIDVIFNNNSPVEAQTGIVSLTRGGTSSGAMVVSQNAKLNFGGGDYEHEVTSSISGDGQVGFSGGTTDIAGTYDVGDTLVNGGTVTFNTVDGMTDTMTLSSGFRGGTGTLSVSGLLTHSAGRFINAGITNADGSMNISGNTHMYVIDEHTLNNNGTATFTGSGPLWIYQGGVFNNNSVFEAKGNGNIDYFDGVVGIFNNNGTYRKLDSTGTSVIDVIFNNNSPVEAQTGIVRLSRGGSSTGDFNVSTDATLEFNGGTFDLNDSDFNISDGGAVNFSNGVYNLEDGASLTGDGLASVTGGTLNVGDEATDIVTAENFTLSGGFRGGTGTLNISGLLTHSAGRFINAGITNANGGIDIIGNTHMYVIDEHTLNNNGTATFTGSGPLWIYQGGTFNNNSVFEAKGNGNIDYFDGVVGIFNNNGTYRKLDSTGTSVIDVVYTTIGTTDIQSGIVSFTRGFTQTAGSTILNGGNVSSSSVLEFQGGVLEGNGDITGGNVSIFSNAQNSPGFSTGAINQTSSSGDYTQDANSEYIVEINGLNDNDLYTVRDVANLNGKLTVDSNFTPGLGDSFVIMTYGSRTGVFTDLDLSINELLSYEVIYDDAAGEVRLNVVPGSGVVTLLQDSFDPENGGVGALNYVGFANWNVEDGSVDLIGNGSNDLLPGNGLYLDLDGSTGNAGRLVTKQDFVLEPGNYRLAFDLAGSQRGGVDTVDVSLGSVYSERFTLSSSDPFTPIVRNFQVTQTTNARLSFDHLGGDNVGLLLDDVSLKKVAFQSDLSVTKDDSADPIPANENLTYTITVNNAGPDDADNVVLQDTLPAGASFVSAVPTQGTCSELNGVVTCLLGTLAVNVPADFQILINSISSGNIVDIAGNIVEIDPPVSVEHGDLESNATIPVFQEKASFVLPGDLLVGASSPGTYGPGNLTPSTIPEGTVVNSHFLHIDPVGTNNDITLQGTISFDSIILGVIARNSRLDTSDSILGATQTSYPIGTSRDIGQEDSFTISSDLRTLDVNLRATTSIDQIRVLTASALINIAEVSSDSLDSNLSNNTATEITEVLPEEFGTIVIVKETDIDGDPTEFNFTGAITATLSDGESASTTVNPGQHVVTETIPSGWELTDITCDDTDSTGDVASRTATLNVVDGETVTCTFQNTEVREDRFLSIAVFEVMTLDDMSTDLTPLLLDFNTLVGRSAVLVEEDPAPEEFDRLFSSLIPDPVIVTFPDGYGGIGRLQVETEMLSLNLEDRGGQFSIKAGQPALDLFTSIGRPDLFTPSMGEVESQDLTGDPNAFFPADSFFNIYAVVETPVGTLFNKEPLLVESEGITSFPPIAFYPHKSITDAAVPLHSLADPDGPPVAVLKRSVHGTRAPELIGVEENDPGFDDAANNEAVTEIEKEPVLPLPEGFPPAGDDNFLSVAVFEVMNLSDMSTVLTPLLLDFNTVVGRSGPLSEDDPAPELFENITSQINGETVTVQFPEGFGGVNRREVNTEIKSLNLEPRGASTFSVKAGQQALDFFDSIGRPDLFTPSIGQVESLDLTGAGAPTTDFPADSFFNVYAVVETPLGTLFNKEPLLVVSRGITSFPPIAFYPHESITSNAVPLHSVVDPDGPPVALLKRAIHGTRAEQLVGLPVDDPRFDDAVENAVVTEINKIPVPTPPPGLPNAGPDSFLSVGVFEVMPIGGSNILTPLLLDFNTEVGRSDPLIEDDPAPETSEDLTSQINGQTVTVLFPEGFGGVGRREVTTEITSLLLEERGGGGFSVRAGQPALDFLTTIGADDLFTPSLGQVESNDQSGAGAPATDFPADSFFNVYAVIETPLGTLFNKDPLIVVSRGISGFPPVAFYPHQSTAENPVELFSIDDPDGPPVALLKRAVHGTRAEQLIGLDVDDPEFDNVANDEIQMVLEEISQPSISIGDVVLNEADGTAAFTLSLSQASAQNITADFSTSAGSATPGDNDYSTTTGTATINAGNTSTTIIVPVIDNLIVELDEDFFVDLSNVSGANILDGQGKGTILNDDSATISIDDVSVNEADGIATFTMSLSNLADVDVSVNLTSVEGTATNADNDYADMSGGTATIISGNTAQSIPVPIIDDSKVELNEAYTLSLSNIDASGRDITFADNEGLGTILNDDSATISIDNVSVNEADGTASFSISLSNQVDTNVGLSFATSDDTATEANNDYSSFNGTTSFSAGDTSETITVSIIDDSTVELDETFTVSLSDIGASNRDVTFADDLGEGTILNDDSAIISIDDVSLSEGNSGDTMLFNFTISLSNQVDTNVDITVATSDGTATEADNDYAPIVQRISISQGDTSQAVNVDVIGDDVNEDDETFTLSLFDLGAFGRDVTFSDAQGEGTILNDDDITISIGDATVNESDGEATFTISLSQQSVQDVTVNFATLGGTATAGSDYTSTTGTLSIDAGDTDATISASIVDDSVVELDESFFVDLTSSTNATILDGQGEGTILNDDSAAISINDVSVNEADGTVSFTVSLNNQVDTNVGLSFATSDGTATTADNDYSSFNGTTSFSAGDTSETITLSIIDDSTVELDESFAVKLSGIEASNRDVTFSDDQGEGTILNDDSATISINDVSVNEADGTASFTVSLSNQVDTNVALGFATADATATEADNDYAPTTGTLTIDLGDTTQSVSISLIDDSTVELDETFTLSLSDIGASNRDVTFSDDQGEGTILNDDSATISIDDLSLEEGNSGDTTFFNFTVSLDNPSDANIDLNFATSDGTATEADNDYAPTSGTLTIDSGDTNGTISVEVIGDDFNEANETFTVSLSDIGASNRDVTFADDQGLGTILNDDDITISIGDVAVNEGNGTASFTLNLSQTSSQEVSIDFTTSDGTAATPEDYTLTTGTVVIPVGNDSTTISVPIVNDSVVELNENFFVNIVSSLGASVLDGQSEGTILNDDSATISIDDSSVNEADGKASFTISLSNQVDTNVGLSFATADGTATEADNDYTPATATLTIDAGDTTQSVSVPVIDDSTVELDETFTLSLSDIGASNRDVTFSDDQGEGTILNDDSATISIDDVSLEEGNSGDTTTFNFTVSLDNPSDANIDLNFATSDGTANEADIDYAPTSGTLTIDAGDTSETISVDVIGDDFNESNETFTLSLSDIGASNRDVTFTDDQGEGTILNDDDITISVGDSSVNEGDGTASFTVSLSQQSVQDATVNFATSDGTGTAGSDYTSTAGSLSINAGNTNATINVSIADDSVVELDESFFVDLTSSTNATILDGQGEGTILNDDSATISIDDVSLEEGNSGDTTTFSFSVSLDNPSDTNIDLNFATADGSATEADNDYTSVNGTLTIDAGITSGTISVDVIGDNVPELDESFFVNMSDIDALDRDVTFSDDQGEGTILNDDAGGETNVNGQLEALNIENPPPGVTPENGIFPITVTLRNNGAALDNIKARVTTLNYLSGAAPGPSLENRDAGTPPRVGAELTVDLLGGTFENGDIIQITFEIRVPLLELFSANVDFFTQN